MDDGSGARGDERGGGGWKVEGGGGEGKGEAKLTSRMRRHCGGPSGSGRGAHAVGRASASKRRKKVTMAWR